MRSRVHRFPATRQTAARQIEESGAYAESVPHRRKLADETRAFRRSDFANRLLLAINFR